MFCVIRQRVAQLGDPADREVAVVADLETQAVEQGHETGSAQRRRPHQGTALRRPNFNGSAQQRNASCDV